MNKSITLILSAVLFLFFCISCNNGNPRTKGLAAGKEACQCYKLEGLEEVSACLDKIELENKEYLSDTAFTNAMESMMLQCVSDGVIDIVKPIKEYTTPQKDTISVKTDSVSSTENLKK